MRVGRGRDELGGVVAGRGLVGPASLVAALRAGVRDRAMVAGGERGCADRVPRVGVAAVRCVEPGVRACWAPPAMRAGSQAWGLARAVWRRPGRHPRAGRRRGQSPGRAFLSRPPERDLPPLSNTAVPLAALMLTVRHNCADVCEPLHRFAGFIRSGRGGGDSCSLPTAFTAATGSPWSPNQRQMAANPLISSFEACRRTGYVGFLSRTGHH